MSIALLSKYKYMSMKSCSVDIDVCQWREVVHSRGMAVHGGAKAVIYYPTPASTFPMQTELVELSRVDNQVENDDDNRVVSA